MSKSLSNRQNIGRAPLTCSVHVPDKFSRNANGAHRTMTMAASLQLQTLMPIFLDELFENEGNMRQHFQRLMQLCAAAMLST